MLINGIIVIGVVIILMMILVVFDYTSLSRLEPIYSAVNGVADSFGIPRNNAWVFLSFIIVLGVAIYLLWRKR